MPCIDLKEPKTSFSGFGFELDLKRCQTGEIHPEESKGVEKPNTRLRVDNKKLTHTHRPNKSDNFKINLHICV